VGHFNSDIGMTTRSALITRKQLNAYEEAKAVRAMLDRGLTEDGAAQALGWPKQRVTARVKILELPERAQQLIGDGVIHLAAVDQLRAIGAVAPDLLDAVIAYLDDGNAWAAERLMREPGWVLDAALTHAGNAKVFAAYLRSASSHEITELRLGKKTEQLYADAEKLHKQLDRYAYGPPQVRFSDEDVDQARAAGVLIEFERGRPIIVDRPLYRELVRTAIKRTHDDLQTKTETAAKDQKTTRAGKAPTDPVTVAKRERDAQLRALTDQAHGANTDLGHALVHTLSSVDPTDIDVARFFVLCRRPHRTNYADRLTMRISRCRTRGNGDEACTSRRQGGQRSRLCCGSSNGGARTHRGWVRARASKAIASAAIARPLVRVMTSGRACHVRVAGAAQRDDRAGGRQREGPPERALQFDCGPPSLSASASRPRPPPRRGRRRW
jgi:hypothetical protein